MFVVLLQSSSMVNQCQVFLAMHNGDVKTYDLACLRKSKYSMPNMWKLYQEMITKTGAPTLASPSPYVYLNMPCVLSKTTLSSTSVETVIHPRNLNLVFVAYAGLLRQLSKGLRLSDVVGRWCNLN